MAISAEYYMLENLAIQRLLAVREKEIDYMEKWINGISTRAALMSGFVVTVFAGIAVQVKTINDDDDAYNTEMQQVYLDIFLSVTMVALGAGVHCMLTSTFTAIWGPGLALRGPRGSVAKAYAAMRRQKHQITGSFVVLIAFFFIQTGIAVWLCPISFFQKWIATSIVIMSAFFTVKTMQNLHQQVTANVGSRQTQSLGVKHREPEEPGGARHDPRPAHSTRPDPSCRHNFSGRRSSSQFSSAVAVGSSVRKFQIRRTP
mmetsp:Transcript_88027/g.251189  ORF Transcript_88027/g.251189 Transcript_88027/m.251189 type:complete len:259 (+) Transcript_88027:206-982(+)